jgi:hypothetical protein
MMRFFELLCTAEHSLLRYESKTIISCQRSVSVRYGHATAIPKLAIEATLMKNSVIAASVLRRVNFLMSKVAKLAFSERDIICLAKEVGMWLRITPRYLTEF